MAYSRYILADGNPFKNPVQKFKSESIPWKLESKNAINHYSWIYMIIYKL